MNNYLKDFNILLQNLDKTKSNATVFNDFLSMATLSLAQPFYRSDKLEKQYMNIVQKYTKEQAEKFSQMLALIVLALEERYIDFLGQVFSLNNFGNSYKGQFFTPYHVSKLMAQINFCDIENQLEKNDYVTLAEPCCGSGGMIIAFAETLKEQGYNYQHQLFVEAIDIDETCFKMTYIQLSLLGIPARVILGDSIALKFQQMLYTPMYFVNGFDFKLRQEHSRNQKSIIIEPKQLNLFKL